MTYSILSMSQYCKYTSTLINYDTGMFLLVYSLRKFDCLDLTLIMSNKLLLITMLPSFSTSSLLNLALIIAYELTKWVLCVSVEASPGSGCHLFRLSVCFKGEALHCR